MPNGNPPKEVEAIGDRVIAAFSRLQTTLRAILDLLHRLFDTLEAANKRREEEYKELRHMLADVKQALAVLASKIDNVEDDVDKVKDRTDPRIMLPAISEDLRKGITVASGPFAISGGKMRFALPTSWVGWVFAMAVSAGLGGLILRGVQWLIRK